MKHAHSHGKETILISGSRGFVGRALQAHLQGFGYHTTPFHKEVVDNIALQCQTGALKIISAVNLAGENIANGTWSAEKKKKILQSRLYSTQAIIGFLSQYAPHARLVSASAMGYYGNRPDAILDENSPAGEGFLADVCRDWETAARRYPHTIITRFGTVLHPSGGFLGAVAPFVRKGGSYVGAAHSFTSWISREDLCRAIHFILELEKPQSIYNLTSQAPIQNAPLFKGIAKLMGGFALFPLPAPLARLFFGEKSSLPLTKHPRKARGTLKRWLFFSTPHLSRLHTKPPSLLKRKRGERVFHRKTFLCLQFVFTRSTDKD